jgi:hypothetical protein
MVPVAAAAISYIAIRYAPEGLSSCLTGAQKAAAQAFEPGLDAIEGLALVWAGLIYWLALQRQWRLGADTRSLSE